MKLQTKIPLKKQPHAQIDYTSKILLLGSCFSENIGEKFNYFKFQSKRNPFGILYHPNAIENLILNSINDKEYDESDVFYHNERWHCFDAHSDLSSGAKEELLKNLNRSSKSTSKSIKEATHIIITLGTAWAYRFIETDTIVANCHKIPQKKFLKQIQSVRAIIESLEAIIDLIKSVNPKVSIVFTVSPVRHLKDGFVENTQSKSHLISAVHQVVEPRHKIHYFPSFEIMMDELRDYRYYAEDMLHPNKTAIDYIWERFQSVWISSDSIDTMNEVDTVQKAINHEAFNPKSIKHKAFLDQLEQKKVNLHNQYEHIVF
ncbi:MAG: GSCFA domain-containing protein [Flavobacteriaceae bacterium]|nr:GSCFA domain-containing protein [Bacteroidia bacterium]NNL16662.1 GSCFA domain-containing protein [Flavobacteriaceae bacterium]